MSFKQFESGIRVEEKVLAANEDDKNDTHDQMPVSHKRRISVARYFRKPFYAGEEALPSDDLSISTPPRRFSLLSVVCLVLLLSLLVLAIVVTTSAILSHRHRSRPPLIDTPPIQPGLPVKSALRSNFPDPTLLKYNGTYYVFATNPGAGILNPTTQPQGQNFTVPNVQIATSTDFVNWTTLPSSSDPLTNPGNWTRQGYSNHTSTTAGQLVSIHAARANVWAPSVIRRPSDGRFLMFYTALVPNTSVYAPAPPHMNRSTHCVGVAVSVSPWDPAGPYTPISEPLACHAEEGGAIDPAAFVDNDGSIYVAYKVDGNNAGSGGLCGNSAVPIHSTPILLQRMNANGTAAEGQPVQILDRSTDDGDGPLVEAPQIIKNIYTAEDGTQQSSYVLFFSSGCTRTPSYDVKYATATNITGPYTRAKNPLLTTGMWKGLVAPGSVGVMWDADGWSGDGQAIGNRTAPASGNQGEIRSFGKGQWRMVFHARVVTSLGAVREMFTATLNMTDIVKVRLQTTTRYSSAANAAVQIWKHEGPLAFYKGTLTPLVGIGACVSVQFGAFNYSRRAFETQNATSSTRPTSTPNLSYTQYYLSGAFAGIANTLLSAPIEHVRIRLQTQPHTPRLYSSPLDCIRQLSSPSHGGITRGLYRGTAVTLLREAQAYGTWFLTFEYLMAREQRRHGVQRKEISTPKIALYGGLAGEALWLASYPFDVVKSKMQSDGFGREMRYRGALDCVRQTWRGEGARGFWKGIGPTLLRAMPVSAGTFAV